MDPPLHRLCEFASPEDFEVEALADARRKRLEFRPRQAISRQGEAVTDVFLLVDGWVTASMEVDFGHRQMIKIHLPGDMLGLPSIALTRAAETLTTLTDAIVDVIPLEALGRLFRTAPRLAFTLFVSTQQERVMLMDHLAAVGQTSAIQRMCTLLLHVHRRLKLLDPDAGAVVDWPLSQEHMAQGTGLTAIHVNRTLQALGRKGLIAREGKRIRLLDVPRLEEISGMPERVFVREPRWLTALGNELTA